MFFCLVSAVGVKSNELFGCRSPCSDLHIFYTIWTITNNVVLCHRPDWCAVSPVLPGIIYKLRKNIKSVNETTHRYCAQVKLQFRPKLTSSTGSYYQKSQWDDSQILRTSRTTIQIKTNILHWLMISKVSMRRLTDTAYKWNYKSEYTKVKSSTI